MATLVEHISDLSTAIQSWINKLRVVTLTFVIDGGGAAITTGDKGDLQIPFAGAIVGWSLLGDAAGSIVVEISKGTYANWPTVSVITASAKPTLVTSRKGTSTTLTGWTTAIAADDVLRIGVNSVTGMQRVVLVVKVRRG